MASVHHTYDPDSNIIKEIEKEALAYINKVPESKRIFIAEGGNSTAAASTFEDSVSTGGEDTGLVYLAINSKSQIISPEPSQKEAVQMLKSEGFNEDVIALHQFLKCSVRMKREKEKVEIHKDKTDLMNNLIYYASTLSKISEDWAGIIKDENAISKITSRINAISKRYLDGKELFKIENGSVESNIDEREFSRFRTPNHNVYPTNKTGKLEDGLRNEMLLTTIYESAKNGKSPFILYGGEHTIELKPALDYLYGEPVLK
jgi:hypothetical protein